MFGFSYDRPDRDVTLIDDRDIFRCTEVVALGRTSIKHDFALVRLDRPVEHRAPLPVRDEHVAEGDRLTLIGYPRGLPAKIDAGGVVIAARRSKNTFVTTFDAYQGNSGSVVLDSASGEVVGVHVGGGPDFETDPSGCQRSFYCPDVGGYGCEGAVETHARLFHRYISDTPDTGDGDTGDGGGPLRPSPDDVHRPWSGGFDLRLTVGALEDREGQRLVAAVSDEYGNHEYLFALGGRTVEQGEVVFEWPGILPRDFIVRLFLDGDGDGRCDGEVAYALFLSTFADLDLHLDLEAEEASPWACDQPWHTSG